MPVKQIFKDFTLNDLQNIRYFMIKRQSNRAQALTTFLKIELFLRQSIVYWYFYRRLLIFGLPYGSVHAYTKMLRSKLLTTDIYAAYNWSWNQQTEPMRSCTSVTMLQQNAQRKWFLYMWYRQKTVRCWSIPSRKQQHKQRVDNKKDLHIHRQQL